MASAAKKKTAKQSDDFVLMGHTRALIRDVWDHWRTTLGHTPDTAKSMMTAAIKEMHKAETALSKKAAKKNVKAKAKAVVSKAKSKAKTAVKRKLK